MFALSVIIIFLSIKINHNFLGKTFIMYLYYKITHLHLP